MSTHHTTDPDAEVDVFDPRLSRFDLVKEGARRDGVEIVHYRPRYPVRGTRAEKRMERVVALMFLTTGAMATLFVVAYIWWPWQYEPGGTDDKFFTPILGLTLGLALLFVGLGIITWGKKLLPEEVSVQDRHDGPSARDEQLLTGATMVNMVDELGVKRRPLVVGSLLLGLAPMAIVAAAPLIGGLIKDPHKKAPGEEKGPLFHTGWDPNNKESNPSGKPIRLVRFDGSPIRPEDMLPASQITVYPGIPHGTSNEHADSPTLLIHLREEDARAAERNASPVNKGSQWGNYVAYSKICTHAGCPASLYEQETNLLLCPCHQSQFNLKDNARPVFGPASRSLPQLPLDLDDEGYFIATSDYKMAIGPAFWERP
jgi:ubiquinol-cytochrome c reductase iron-sulfur subunit